MGRTPRIRPPGKVAEYSKRYRQRLRDERPELNAKRLADLRNYDREYRKNNKKKLTDLASRWRNNNKDRVREYGYKGRQKVKIETLTHYGRGEAKCLSCGFSNIDALTLDHIENNGFHERKAADGKHRALVGVQWYYRLRAEGFPGGYQTLCANCNLIKQINIWRKNRGTTGGA